MHETQDSDTSSKLQAAEIRRDVIVMNKMTMVVKSVVEMQMRRVEEGGDGDEVEVGFLH